MRAKVFYGRSTDQLTDEMNAYLARNKVREVVNSLFKVRFDMANKPSFSILIFYHDGPDARGRGASEGENHEK